MAEDNERWMTDGDCSKCRREPYCGTVCRAQKQRRQAIIRKMMREKLKERLQRKTEGGAGV